MASVKASSDDCTDVWGGAGVGGGGAHVLIAPEVYGGARKVSSVYCATRYLAGTGWQN